jgi:hypothetical protein
VTTESEGANRPLSDEQEMNILVDLCGSYHLSILGFNAKLSKARQKLFEYASVLAAKVSPLKVGDITDEATFRELAKSITGRDYSYTYIPHGKNKVRVTHINGYYDSDGLSVQFQGVVLKKDGTDSSRTTGWRWTPPKRLYEHKPPE